MMLGYQLKIQSHVYVCALVMVAVAVVACVCVFAFLGPLSFQLVIETLRAEHVTHEKPSATETKCCPIQSPQTTSHSKSDRVSVSAVSSIFCCCWTPCALAGVIVLPASGGYQSQKMWLFPFNPPLRG